LSFRTRSVSRRIIRKRQTQGTRPANLLPLLDILSAMLLVVILFVIYFATRH
jgi:hypothetical protein